jgi:hypothetical protein
MLFSSRQTPFFIFKKLDPVACSSYGKGEGRVYQNEVMSDLEVWECAEFHSANKRV